MKNVILKMDVSLDGFVNAKGGKVDWIYDNVNSDLKACITDMLWEADVHIMGRMTYQDMAKHWPSSTEDYAPPMNEKPKVVFSDTIKEVHWQYSRLANRDITEEISQLKQQSGNYILAHGGARFAQSLSRLGLIDEYRLIIHPVILGGGLPLFKNISDAIKLNLVNTRVFDTGAVLHTYQTIRN
ncbi:dihydrofolate reductase [Gracilibacillus salitolerans]|uniref:Dihydrofolate reductase n=1 Tax=Gracilibacillus salitolerans TaxID=2663022 RepID=A0A5Q2TFL7_9BACI|nr:dihydrofolate reductase family protein [Gracilibacillus salitolerans]QGH33456.1 dihydrofolate reductase [Gracilibacillus salitolerans]